MKISLTLADESVPRTAYYDRFVAAVRAHAAFTPDETAADILLPAEDTALETNWPRYGNQASAYIRGVPDMARYNQYLDRLVAAARPLCIVNMHPFIRVPQLRVARPHTYVADGCLPIWERVLNPRTVSMPALPAVAPQGASRDKSVLASFRGVMSHPSRAALQKLHDGTDVICEIVPRDNHVGRLDATAGKNDAAFTELMAKSVFAFVPRGDALFSYRLLEAMAFGCIPIVLSDGWVLPFDRTIDWQQTALALPEATIPGLPLFLRSFSASRIAELQQNVQRAYARHFASLERIVDTLIGELERLHGH